MLIKPSSILPSLSSSLYSLYSLCLHPSYPFSSIYNMQQIKNPNITFPTKDWSLNLYSFYPQIRKKRGINISEISAEQIVLALVFVNRNMEFQKAWLKRKGICFGFGDVARLVGLRIGSNQHMEFTNVTQSKYAPVQTHKKLILIDNPASQQLSITFQQHQPQPPKPQKKKPSPPSPSSPNSPQSQDQLSQLLHSQKDTIKTALPYDQYRVMNKLIQSCLIELGGWGIMFDLSRKQQFDKLGQRDFRDREIDEVFQRQRRD